MWGISKKKLKKLIGEFICLVAILITMCLVHKFSTSPTLIELPTNQSFSDFIADIEIEE